MRFLELQGLRSPLFFVLCAAMSGCAGPSKARYAELLHECRDVNREHLRMLREYEGYQCVKGLAHGGPEQAAGIAEMGLGGF